MKNIRSEDLTAQELNYVLLPGLRAYGDTGYKHFD